jgi:hypothetical protein
LRGKSFNLKIKTYNKACKVTIHTSANKRLCCVARVRVPVVNFLRKKILVAICFDRINARRRRSLLYWVWPPPAHKRTKKEKRNGARARAPRECNRRAAHTHTLSTRSSRLIGRIDLTYPNRSIAPRPLPPSTFPPWCARMPPTVRHNKDGLIQTTNQLNMRAWAAAPSPPQLFDSHTHVGQAASQHDFGGSPCHMANLPQHPILLFTPAVDRPFLDQYGPPPPEEEQMEAGVSLDTHTSHTCLARAPSGSALF